jgi:hypothetical protein
MAIPIAEFQREMDHAAAVFLIRPVIADGEPVLRHCAFEKWLIGHRGIGQGHTRAKYPAIGVRGGEQAVIGVLRSQCSKQRAARLAIA